MGMGRMGAGALMGAAWGGYAGIDNGAGGFFGGAAMGAAGGAAMGKYAGKLNRGAVNAFGRMGRKGGLAGIHSSSRIATNAGFGQSDQLGGALAGMMGKLMSKRGIGRGTVGRQAISALGIGTAGLIGSSVMDSNRGY